MLFVIVAALQFAGDVTQLAGATVLLLLSVFVIVNSALVILKRREGDLPGRFNVPTIIPVLGSAICLVLILGQVLQSDWRSPAIAGGLIALILITYATSRRGGYGADTEQ